MIFLASTSGVRTLWGHETRLPQMPINGVPNQRRSVRRSSVSHVRVFEVCGGDHEGRDADRSVRAPDQDVPTAQRHSLEKMLGIIEAGDEGDNAGTSVGFGVQYVGHGIVSDDIGSEGFGVTDAGEQRGTRRKHLGNQAHCSENDGA